MSNYVLDAWERSPVMLEFEVGETKFEATFDARIDYREDYSADTPSYPIERDFDTTISTVNHQIGLNMNLFLTPYPVTWSSLFGRSVDMVKETIIRLYWIHSPVTVKTQDETYENMAIKSLTFTRSKDTGDSYEVSMTLVRIKTTKSAVVAIEDWYSPFFVGPMPVGMERPWELDARAAATPIPPQVSGGELKVTQVEEDDDPLRYVPF